MINFRANLIGQHESIKAALQLLNERPDHLTLFVIDDEERLVGTLTDGDIRRGLLDGVTIETEIKAIMFRHFRKLIHNQYSLEKLNEIRSLRIRLIPIVDESGKIVRVVDLAKKKSLLPIDAVIMAGGKGSRLLPLTKDTPKPLLKIGDKPIIEYNIDRLLQFGINNITITIKYLGQQIANYFKDGKEKGATIKYFEETEALGTIGAIKQISDFTQDYILVMNSDLLTNIDLEKMFAELLSKSGEIIVATSPYEVKIPYGVIETEGETVKSLKEKPTYTYQSNAGIYIFKKSCIDVIPEGVFYNATDLLAKLLEQDEKVLYYPILEYWLDIGKPADFEKAQKDIKHISF